jgi:hypothetical protein
VIRFAYNRLIDGWKDMDIRIEVKSKLENINLVYAWLVDSSTTEAKIIYPSK